MVWFGIAMFLLGLISGFCVACFGISLKEKDKKQI